MTAQKRLLTLFAFAAPVFVLDLLLKHWVLDHMAFRATIPLLDGWFALTHARNEGAAWSMLAGQKWLLVTFAVVASGAIIWHASKAKTAKPTYIAALGLLLGGAVGNLVDRLRWGWVVDMFDLQNGSGKNVFPIFNVADIAINVGVGLLLLLSFIEARREKRAKAAQRA